MMDDSHIFRIGELKKQLLSLGYYPFQLEEIIKDELGTTSLEQLDERQADRLITALTFYINFSSKCKSAT